MYEFIKQKIDQLNENPIKFRDQAWDIISQLLEYIKGDKEIEKNDLYNLIKNLTFFTTGLSFPLDENTIVSRAVKYTEDIGDYYDDVSRLSYIPIARSNLANLNRMNEANSPMFYGCLGNNANSIGTALLEIGANKNDKINMLFSKTTQKLFVIPIGVFDYFRRDVNHPFDLHDDYKNIYEFFKSNTNHHAMIALHLCDAFLTDVLTREGSERLYNVTSLIAKDFFTEERLDGLIYPSVKFSGHPNIVIKPSSVDKKIEHINTSVISVKHRYEYGIYETIETHKGNIVKNNIEW